MKLYCVVDHKAKSIVTVFPSVCDETAERSFLMLLTGTKNIYTDFPEDFDLYPLAELSVEGSKLLVTKDAFKIDSFIICDALKRGVDYDKRYLAMIHADRFPVLDNASESEVSSDGE